jgi:Lhr-like helicase
MVTIVLAIVLLVALAGLGLEIGIASWNIRRANKYQRREAAAEHTTERAVRERQDMAERLAGLDKYAADISWLLNFLFNRYDKFSDLEEEVKEGLKGVTDDTAIGEAHDRYKDLKRALKLVKITVRVSDRMENLMNSITQQLGQIMADFEDEEDAEKEKAPDEQATAKSGESSDAPTSEPTASDTKASEGDPLQS